MKITLELPDRCKFLNVAFVFSKHGGFYCGSRIYDTDDLKDGTEINVLDGIEEKEQEA